MFGTLGFSYVGFVYLVMLLIPSLIWANYLPVGYNSSKENGLLVMAERFGQASCTCCILIFSEFNHLILTLWSLWLLVSFLLLLLYEVCWIRYVKGKHTVENFYRGFLGFPVPLASLPVLVFLLLGIYAKILWLIGSAVLLGTGHISIHLQHKRHFRSSTLMK